MTAAPPARRKRAPAWLALEYVHPDDGSPMAGAPYRVTFADGSVREGTLDAEGRARLDGLPPALAGTPVEVTFGEAAGAYEAVPGTGAPNPAYRGPVADVALFDGRPVLLASAAAGDAAGDAALAAAAPWAQHFAAAGTTAADALDWLWGVLQGDFADNPTTGQVVAGALVTMVPGLDQLADARDVVAALRALRDPAGREDPWAWVALAVTLVGLVPVVGSAAKGALKLVVRGLRGGETATRRALYAVLRRLGRGDPAGFAARHLSAGALGDAVRAGLARTTRLVGGFFRAAARSRWAPAAVRAAAARGLDELAALERVAGPRLDAAVRTLDTGVQRALRTGESDAVARGTTNARVQGEAEVAEPPTHGAGKEPDGRPRVAARVIEARRQLATDFYREQGYSEGRLRQHLTGIDLEQPVDVVTLPRGTVVEQWQSPGNPQGDYYALPGTKPGDLGIADRALNRATGAIEPKVVTRYVLTEETRVLRSTAASVADTWSVPGQTIPTAGGRTQFFSAAKQNFTTHLGP